MTARPQVEGVKPSGLDAGTLTCGFTVIELVIAMSLFAILAFTAVPSFSALMQQYGLRGASREMQAELQWARMAAIARNHDLRVIVLSSTTYKIHDDTNSNGAIDSGENVVVHHIEQTSGTSMSLSPVSGTITFAPDGTAPQYGNLTVTNGALSKTVTVSRGGKVRVQ
jgi:prepilin-type N-terminal cleavage/methylation domain-containing protein